MKDGDKNNDGRIDFDGEGRGGWGGGALAALGLQAGWVRSGRGAPVRFNARAPPCAPGPGGRPEDPLTSLLLLAEFLKMMEGVQ